MGNKAQWEYYSNNSSWLTVFSLVSLSEICLQRRQACLCASPRDTALCEQWGQGVPDINLEQRSEVTEHYCQPLAFCSILSSASNLFLNRLWHKNRSGPFHLQIKLPVTLHRTQTNLLFFSLQSLLWQRPEKKKKIKFFSVRKCSNRHHRRTKIYGKISNFSHLFQVICDIN